MKHANDDRINFFFIFTFIINKVLPSLYLIKLNNLDPSGMLKMLWPIRIWNMTKKTQRTAV